MSPGRLIGPGVVLAVLVGTVPELLDPKGSYVVRVQNYAGLDPWKGTVTFEGPGAYNAPIQEAYQLTCETPQGVVKSARQVFVARGERLALDLRKDCRR